MNYKRLLIATLVLWVFGVIWMTMTCGWLFNWVYQIPPMIWKTPAEMATSANMLGSSLAGLIAHFLFVLFYALVYKCLPIKNDLKKGLLYGLAIYLVGPFSGTIGMPFYMTIANQVVGYWIINFFAAYLIMGVLVGVIYKK